MADQSHTLVFKQAVEGQRQKAEQAAEPALAAKQAAETARAAKQRGGDGETADELLGLSVIADNPGGILELILPAIASRFEIEEHLLSLHNFGPANFLLISPDEQSATRIFNNGRPLVIPPARLHLMRWSRFLHSEAAAFPSAVDVELRGILAHAWDMETAAQLLGDDCVPVLSTQKQPHNIKCFV